MRFVCKLLSRDSAIDALPTAGEEALKENNVQKKGKDWISRDGRQERAFSSGLRQRTAF